MRFTILLGAAAIALAGCSMMPFGSGEAEKPVAATTSGAVPLAVTTTASHDLYEIKDAHRGMVRRVKILLNGRTVDTLVMSRKRETSTTYCCTEDGCQEIEAAKACTTFKMTCDKDGACIRVGSKDSSRL
jgi:hypothetical protein